MMKKIASESATLRASAVTNDDLAKWLERIGCYVILDVQGSTARSSVEMIGERIAASRV